MCVKQLRLAVAAQQQREIVEPGDDSLKLDPLDEEHRHRSLVPPHGVEKKILKILALIGHIGLLFLAAIPHRRSVCQTAPSLWRHLYAAKHPRRLGQSRDRKSTRLNSSN